MDTTAPIEPRQVLVSVAPAPERRSADDHAAGDLMGRGMSWITGRGRVIEILRDAIAARNTQLQIDGSSRVFRVNLDSVRLGATRAMSGAIALECRLQTGDFVKEPWTAGVGCTLWFADASGIYSFRSKIIGGTKTALLIGQPMAAVRYCRREDRRFPVPAGELPRVALPLTDGTWWEGKGVRDLSIGGLQLALPPHIQLPLGHPTRLGLGLHPQRFLEMTVIARHMEADDTTGEVLYGLEFVEPSAVARMAITRFTTRLAEEHRSDGADFGLPALPAAVSLHLRVARHDGLGPATGAAPARPLTRGPQELPPHVILHR